MSNPEIKPAFDTHRNQAEVCLGFEKDKKLIALVKSGTIRLKKPIQRQTLMQHHASAKPEKFIEDIYALSAS